MTDTPQLPVPVSEQPHWRVNIRPRDYDPSRISSLRDCTRLIERSVVRLRGWDYPHLGRENEREHGNTWIGSWSDFMGHLEYWRFYQSGQFVHLFSVREATRPEWREQLQKETASHLSHYRDVNWDAVPGFISVVNTIYCVTEIVEFATRMAEAGVYDGTLDLAVSMNGVKGFVLTTDWGRAWMNYYAASSDVVGNVWSLKTDDLLSRSTEQSLDILTWLFERFGWLEPSPEVIRKDIDDFKSGRL